MTTRALSFLGLLALLSLSTALPASVGCSRTIGGTSQEPPEGFGGENVGGADNPGGTGATGGNGENAGGGGSETPCETSTLDCDDDASTCETSALERATCGDCDSSCEATEECLTTGCTARAANLLASWGARVNDFHWTAAGTMYLTGTFFQPIDFGNGTADPGDEADFFLAKYSAGGELIWVEVAAASGGTFGNKTEGFALAVDAEENLYVTGSLRGEINFGNGLIGDPDSQEDIFVVSYTKGGDARWSDVYASGGSSVDQGTGIAVGADRVYVAGRTGRGLDLGGGSIGQLANRHYLFVASFDKATGGHEWSKGYPYETDDGFGDISDLVLDSKENVYVSGAWRGAIDLGGGERSGSTQTVGAITINTETGFVASYSGTNGTYRWMQTQGGDNTDWTYGLAVDAEDRIYATGRVTEAANFGDGVREVSEDLAAKGFLVSYESNGTHRFDLVGENHAAHGSNYGTAVTIHDGVLYVAVAYSGETSFGPADFRQVGGSVPLAGFDDVPSRDVSLVAIDEESLSLEWLRVFGGVEDDSGGRVRMRLDAPVLQILPQSVMSIDGTDLEPLGNSTTGLVHFATTP